MGFANKSELEDAPPGCGRRGSRFSILEGAHMLAFVPLRLRKTSGPPSPWSSNEPRAPPGTQLLTHSLARSLPGHLRTHARTRRIGTLTKNRNINQPSEKNIMRVVCTFCGLFLAIAIVNCSPIVKRDAEEPSPENLNSLDEIYVFEADEAADSENKDRDKRKVGLVLGVKNGILNFVFGKLDSLLDSKTKALDSFEEANKAKNVIYGIDNTRQYTTEFLSSLASKKIQAASSSIGPLINSATTFFTGASSGLSNAFVSKLAPLSALSGGLSGGAGGGSAHGSAPGSPPGSALLGTLLTQGIGTLSSISQTSGNLGSLSGGISGGGHPTSGGSDASSGAKADAGINVGAFANLAGKVPITTTTDNTPIFDRNKVSLDIPSRAFGSGFTIITNISKILSSIILNSARRTQTFLEIFKPFFRGSFAIKGLPSDNLH